MERNVILEMYRFDREVAHEIMQYGSHGVAIGRVVQIKEQVQVGCMHVAADGLIGNHQAASDQLFMVVSGEGWVRGQSEDRIPIHPGQAAFWRSSEWHESGSEIGMLAVVIEADTIDPSKYMPILDRDEDLGTVSSEPDWLIWARRLQAIAQTGMAYNDIEYDLERYRQISAIAAEILDSYSDANLDEIHDFFAYDSGYATPKVDVRGAAFRDDQVLLVRERLDGRWTLPGGWADVNDAPSEAVEREMLEESGFEARATKLAMVLDKSRHPHPPSPGHTYKIFFVCDLIGGDARESFETDAVGFFALDNLPELSIDRVLATQIERMYQHALDPGLPTDFD